MRVIVVGAGVGGLTTAAVLARAGLAARRAERLDLRDMAVDVTERLNPLAQAQEVLMPVPARRRKEMSR